MIQISPWSMTNHVIVKNWNGHENSAIKTNDDKWTNLNIYMNLVQSKLKMLVMYDEHKKPVVDFCDCVDFVFLWRW